MRSKRWWTIVDEAGLACQHGFAESCDLSQPLHIIGGGPKSLLCRRRKEKTSDGEKNCEGKGQVPHRLRSYLPQKRLKLKSISNWKIPENTDTQTQTQHTHINTHLW